jgi:lysophospholipase L1-like esterase
MSTHPDGRRESFRMNGTAWYSLVPAYTDDGGHLNAVGRVHVAAAFVRAIAAAVRSRQRAAA